MLKNIYLTMAFLAACSFIPAVTMAQWNGDSERHDRGRDNEPDSEIEFKIGDTTITIGSNKRYDGRDNRELESRLRRLERAVRFLMEDNGYRPHRREAWECSLETPFDGEFYARADTERAARSDVLGQCNRKTNNSRVWCDADDVKCNEIR